MKTLKLGLCAFAVLAQATVASAAWNNVFQATLPKKSVPASEQGAFALASRAVPGQATSKMVVGTLTCDSCGKSQSSQQCTTRYIQRTFYQPVTTYQSKSYYEQVTSYQTSYYYEPCTSYSYSCYFDPCTCSYQQVATPTTSYSLRSKSCPVTSWVQRCAYEPVTSYRQSCYYEPVTTCCNTTCTTTTGSAVGTIPQTANSVPIVTEQRSTTPPVITEQRNPAMDIPAAPPATSDTIPSDGMGMGNGVRPSYNRSYFPNTSNKQPATQNNWKAASPTPVKANPPAPAVKLDRIVVGPNSQVEGRVVRSDNAPRPNSMLTFVSTNGRESAQRVTANQAGRFRVTLPSGGWLVYVASSNGTQVYHSRIEVGGNGSSQVTLVSRN